MLQSEPFIRHLPLAIMVIAVNTRYLLKENLDDVGYFTKEVLEYLVRNHRDHEFHFFFDRPYEPAFLFSSNVKAHVLKPTARHPLLWKYWFDVKVSSTLKKIKADVFLSPDGQCSLTTKVPQCVVIQDLGFLHHPDGYRKSHLQYYKHYTPRFIQKARTIITVSEFLKQEIIQHYQADETRIKVVYKGVKELFVPIGFEEQNSVKDRFTAGTEFFLYAGPIHPSKNLINLLKAFSKFKKRLQSSMKLVLAGKMDWKNNGFQELLKTYKYKDDVVLTGYLDEKDLARVMASAYAFIYPSVYEGFAPLVVEAMKCGVSVLTSKGSSMEEITDDAALYFDPQNIDDMSDKLMRIYKDEDGRKSLIEKGIAIAEKFSWQRTADAVWEGLPRPSGGGVI